MEYSTTDIILAAVLKLKGYKLLRIDMTGSRGTFVFEDIDERIIISFDMGSVLVEPTAFNGTIKQLSTATRRMQRENTRN